MRARELPSGLLARQGAAGGVPGDGARDTGVLMLKWLIIAFVAEYGLRQVLPAEAIGSYVGGDSVAAIALATLVGAPIYLDAYAALPLVRALLDAGMGPGAALAFLIASGIVSAWAAVPVNALIRLPLFLAYIAMAVAAPLHRGWCSAGSPPKRRADCDDHLGC